MVRTVHALLSSGCNWMNSDDFNILMKHNISSFIVRFILLLIIYVFLKNIFNDGHFQFLLYM